MQNTLLAARVGAEIFPVKGGKDFRGISVFHGTVDDSLADALLVGAKYMGDKDADFFGMIHRDCLLPIQQLSFLFFIYCKGRGKVLQFILMIRLI